MGHSAQALGLLEPSYLAVEPLGKLSRPGLGRRRVKERGPCGAAPALVRWRQQRRGPRVLEVVEGGLRGGGHPSLGLGSRESGSEALAESPHLPHSLVEPPIFLQRNLSRSPRKTVGKGQADLQSPTPIKPTSHLHEEGIQLSSPGPLASHMTPSLNLTGGGLRRRPGCGWPRGSGAGGGVQEGAGQSCSRSSPAGRLEGPGQHSWGWAARASR